MSVSNFAAMTATSSVMTALTTLTFQQSRLLRLCQSDGKEVYPIDCESFTTKERENFKDALASLHRTFSSLLLSSTKK